jgi:hypothetical protein
MGKIRWKKPKLRTALLPAPRTISQSEVDAILGRDVREGAVLAGWLAHCAQKPTGSGEGSKRYALAAVQGVEDRLLEGEWPVPTGAAKRR